MTKAAALQQFFSSFGIPAYASASVPDDARFPWLTYDLSASAWDGNGGGSVSLTVNLWYYTTSEATPNAKAEEISKAIGYGGKLLTCDDGYIWLKRGSPWCQSLHDESDSNIKRRYINITADYLTFS